MIHLTDPAATTQGDKLRAYAEQVRAAADASGETHARVDVPGLLRVLKLAAYAADMMDMLDRGAN